MLSLQLGRVRRRHSRKSQGVRIPRRVLPFPAEEGEPQVPPAYDRYSRVSLSPPFLFPSLPCTNLTPPTLTFGSSRSSTINHLPRLGIRLISIIGFLDSIVSAKQNAAKYSHEVSPNRELVALGMANLGAAWVCGGKGGGVLPAYGSITRYVPLL